MTNRSNAMCFGNLSWSYHIRGFFQNSSLVKEIEGRGLAHAHVYVEQIFKTGGHCWAKFLKFQYFSQSITKEILVLDACLAVTHFWSRSSVMRNTRTGLVRRSQRRTGRRILCMKRPGLCQYFTLPHTFWVNPTRFQAVQPFQLIPTKFQPDLYEVLWHAIPFHRYTIDIGSFKLVFNIICSV